MPLSSTAVGLQSAAHSGWLHKRGEVNTAFKRRFFILSGDHLAWHESPKTAAKGSLKLTGANVSTDATSPAGRYRFEVIPAVTSVADSVSSHVSSSSKASQLSKGSRVAMLPLRRGSDKAVRATSRVLVLEAESAAERGAWTKAIQHAAALNEFPSF